MVQLHTFRFFQLASVRWKELICPYLNTKRSTQEPNQDVRNGGCRREYVITKFAINTNAIRISHVPSQATNRESHSHLLSHTIFVLVPIHFRVSQSQTILIQWWALEGLLHLWHAAEKKVWIYRNWASPAAHYLVRGNCGPFFGPFYGGKHTICTEGRVGGRVLLLGEGWEMDYYCAGRCGRWL